jgi:ribosome modulation factor
MMHWIVIVHTIAASPAGRTLGMVFERTEELARCAALSRFGSQGSRGVSDRSCIYETDSFDVRAVASLSVRGSQWMKGYKAAAHLKPRASCPYSGGELAREWLSGYDARIRPA